LTFNMDVYENLKKSTLPQKKKKRMNKIFDKEIHTIEELKLISTWIRKYTEGYQSKSGGKMPLGTIIGGLLTSPDYTMKDCKAMIINGYSKNKSLLSEMIHVDLRKELLNMPIPYMILQGNTDIVTSTKAISEFISEDQNENLFLRVVDNSAHFPSAKAIESILTEGISFLSE